MNIKLKNSKELIINLFGKNALSILFTLKLKFIKRLNKSLNIKAKTPDYKNQRHIGLN